MERVLVTDFISTYQTLVKEVIEEYAEKNNISSITSKDLNPLHRCVPPYCKRKIAQILLQIPKLSNGAEGAQKNTEEKTIGQGKCMESAEIHQSATGPSEITELNNEDGREQEILKEEQCKGTSQIHQSSVGHFKQSDTGYQTQWVNLDPGGSQIPKFSDSTEREQEIMEEERWNEEGKPMESAQLHPGSAGPSEVIIDVEPFMKLMAEQHKQQQESQENLLKTLLDHLSHQEEQILQRHQDIQSKLTGDFMKHSEMQVTLLSQALSNLKTQQPVRDDPVNVDNKDSSCYKPSRDETTNHSNTGHYGIPERGSAPKLPSFAYSEDTWCYAPSRAETAYNPNTGHNSSSGRGAAERIPSFGHFEVAKKANQTFPLFDRYELGQEFCKWFYILLNSQNPSHGQEPLDWGPHIFWDNAKFSIEDYNFAEHCKEEYTGDECVSAQLLEMTQKQKLTFTPKLDSERFKCVNSRHGLVVVAVTGVISNNDNYSRVFDQIFGLIMCPSSGQYKIRSLYLRIENMAPYNPEHNVPPLQYTTEQLQEFD